MTIEHTALSFSLLLGTVLAPAVAPAVAAAPAMAITSATAIVATSSAGTCQSLSLPVALAPGLPASQVVSGTYCEPPAWAAGPHEVDLMTPGATYNSTYWDWPVDPSLYSFVDKTLQAGRATFDYDRVGTGASSHPLSTSLTIDAEAYVLH